MQEQRFHTACATPAAAVPQTPQQVWYPSALAPSASPAPPSSQHFYHRASVILCKHSCPCLSDACPVSTFYREFPKYLGTRLLFHLLLAILLTDLQPHPASTADHPTGNTPATISPHAWCRARGHQQSGLAQQVTSESPPGPVQLALTHAGLQIAPCDCLFDTVFLHPMDDHQPASTSHHHAWPSCRTSARCCPVGPWEPSTLDSPWDSPEPTTTQLSDFSDEQWPQPGWCYHHTFMGTRTRRGSSQG